MLDFQDEFNGNSVDYSKWKFYADDTSLGGGLVQNSTITVSGGTAKLNITIFDGNHYAVLNTVNTWGAGYYEGRMKFSAQHSGYWSSAGWGNTLADGYEFDEPESFGGCGGTFHLIYAPGGNRAIVPDPAFDAQTDLCNGFHIIGYEIDQTTGGTFYIDGRAFGNVPGAYSNAAFDTQLFYGPDSGGPLEVDWVRHYIKLP
jgi:hypothetical protein